jgi:hypothetical protein
VEYFNARQELPELKQEATRPNDDATSLQARTENKEASVLSEQGKYEENLISSLISAAVRPEADTTAIARSDSILLALLEEHTGVSLDPAIVSKLRSTPRSQGPTGSGPAANTMPTVETCNIRTDSPEAHQYAPELAKDARARWQFSDNTDHDCSASPRLPAMSPRTYGEYSRSGLSDSFSKIQGSGTVPRSDQGIPTGSRI